MAEKLNSHPVIHRLVLPVADVPRSVLARHGLNAVRSFFVGLAGSIVSLS